MALCDEGRETYKVFDCRSIGTQDHRRGIVGRPAFRFGVDALEVELLPHGLHQLVHIPAMFRADGHGVGNPVQQVELFDADRVDLVQAVYDGDITARQSSSAVNLQTTFAHGREDEG